MVNFFYLDKDPIKCAKYYCNKHVLKIPIEIAQILSKIHHELETGIDYCKIYKNSLVVKNTLGPYCWIKQSYDNYLWTSKLGLALINEYKLRYNKNAHKSEIILQYLADNPPKLPKIGITRFIGTNKYDMFQYISNDPIICGRYNYAEMKCKNDKWNIHGPPDWYIEIEKNIVDEKNMLINKINEQVRTKLPSMITQGDKVRRFHSFLRVTYDHLFQGKWDIKAKMMNKYNKNEPLIHQLTFPQLFFVYQISKSLENKKILSKLNTESLRYRNKLKFPIKNINYRENQEYYIYTKKNINAEQYSNLDVKPYSNLNVKPYSNLNVKPYSNLNVKPYSNEILNILEDNLKIYNLLVKYVKNKDFIGIDMIQKCCKINKSIKILELIENNDAYKNWITSFNWRIANPYQPKQFIYNNNGKFNL